MARMHSRDKGKSGSIKPVEKKVPSWVRYKDKEVEKLIIKLAKKGNSTAVIGSLLRDSYGVPDVKLIANKSISQILKENDLYPEIPEDLMALIKKLAQIRKHMETNRGDNTAKRGLQLTESKIKRLVKYYKSTNVLPQDWRFDVSKIGLLID